MWGWWDRQLHIDSGDRHRLSLVNWVVVALILISAALFAMGTEESLQAFNGPELSTLNLIIVLIFALEFTLRIWSAGASRGLTRLSDRISYAGPFWLFVDFVAFAPELVLLLAIWLLGVDSPEWIEGLRLFRVFRLLKLGRYIPGARILVATLRSIQSELLVSFLISAGLIYGAAVVMYFAEHAANPEHFGSVLRALWWSVITLTTVGYGDAFPLTLAGRVAAGVIALVGVGIIALPSGLIAGAFIEQLRLARQAPQKTQDQVPTDLR